MSSSTISPPRPSAGSGAPLAGVKSPPEGPSIGRLKKIVFMVLIYGLPLLVGESAVRSHRGQLLFTGSFREQQLALLKSAYPAEYDDELGYAPRAGYSGSENAWGAQVTIDSRSLRVNGNGTVFAGTPIVAVGDSFTFGDQVADHETWPAYLEGLLALPTFNGGVFGYGFDQTILRAEQLVDEYQPAALIVSIIDDDIDRCELSCRYAEKPYFDVVDGRLMLCNSPPPVSQPSPTKKVLGYSALADELMQRVAPRWWRLTGSGDVREHKQGLLVCQLLLRRLARIAKAHHTHVLFVVQGRPSHWDPRLDELAAEANKLGIATLNLQQRMKEAIANDPTLASKWFYCHIDPVLCNREEYVAEGSCRHEGHMRPEGNAWVAGHIADRLREMKTTDTVAASANKAVL